MLRFDETPYGSFRVWMPKDHKARDIIKKYCLWGGPDRESEDVISFEIANDDSEKLFEALIKANFKIDVYWPTSEEATKEEYHCGGKILGCTSHDCMCGWKRTYR